ncbi:MAG: hypothetical protein ACRDJH_06225 [Thermomicrobiales bacterium]
MSTALLPLRHRIAGGAIGLCLAATLGVAGTFAQESEATPEAETTPAVEDSVTEESPAAPEFEVAPEAETRMVEQIQAVSDTIEAVRADRDAAGEIDATIVDQLLDRATSLLDAARQSLDGGESLDAPRQTMAAQSAAMAAEALVRAQLSNYGLPSQQAGASRTLDTAYRQVKASTERMQESTDEGVTFFVTTAQELYRQAFDLYNAGTYAQATETARVAASLGQIAETLGSDAAAFSAEMKDGVIAAVGGSRADVHLSPVEPGAGVSAIEGGPHADVIVPRAGTAHVATSSGGTMVIEAVPAGDFSTESPIEVPEPEF